MISQIIFKSILSLFILSATPVIASAGSDEGCTLDYDFYPQLCTGAITYMRDYTSSERSTGPYKITKAMTRTSEGLFGEVQLLSTSEKSTFSLGSNMARTKGCLKKVCVGQTVKVQNQSQIYKVLGYYASYEALVLGVCETASCAGAENFVVNVTPERIRPLDKSNSTEDRAKSVDNSVFADLEREFQQFAGISMSQYLNLKKNRDPNLLNAQRMVKQYLDSSVVQLTSGPTSATRKEIDEEFNRRQQFYRSPLMIQTGLELVAHELLKPEEQIQCNVVATTLRFVALGVDGWGRKTPGLDYINNQLMIVHLYAAMVDGKQKNALPCAKEFSDLTIKNPSLKNQYRPGCSAESWNMECHTQKGKFWDTETMMAITKLARTYVKDDYYFSGGGGSNRSGFFGMTKGYYASFEATVFFDAPEQTNRRSAKITFEYERPRVRGALFDSTVFMTPIEGYNKVSKGELPKVTSQQVMLQYSQLAETFLD